jgi:hypothetical protein
VGGLAVGTISIGGLAVGGLTLAGPSLGLMAFGWAAALGGLAVAREFALGGAAMGAHANDAAAREFFQQAPARMALALLQQARWWGLLVLIPIVVGLRAAQEDAPASRGRAR